MLKYSLAYILASAPLHVFDVTIHFFIHIMFVVVFFFFFSFLFAALVGNLIWVGLVSLGV